ncbi:unnamed protein product [Discula destructiva]
MSPPDVKSGFGGVGTAIAYGGPAAMPAMPVSDHGLLSEVGFSKPAVDMKLTRDGQPAKRRGPKPDSKPAMTRRQELNRQAQRTHRERKELYIKDLENQVLRLRELFTDVSQDRQRLAEENNSLKVLLRQNGLSMSQTADGIDDSTSNASGGPYLGSSSASNSNSYGLPSATTQQTSSTPPSVGGPGSVPQGLSPLWHSPGHQAAAFRRPSLTGQTSQSYRNADIDYEKAGISWVLHLEQPCMDHMPWLVERSSASGAIHPSGHALMASCPSAPASAPMPDSLSGKFTNNLAPTNESALRQQTGFSKTINTSPAVGRRYIAVPPDPSCTGTGQPASTAMEIDGLAPLRTIELSKGDLNTLLNLSKKLNLDGCEITPIQAWGLVLGHPRLKELDEADFLELAEVLRSKIRCYGFGAVLEEFELRDALEAVLSTKPEMFAAQKEQAMGRSV